MLSFVSTAGGGVSLVDISCHALEENDSKLSAYPLDVLPNWGTHYQ